MKSLMKCGLLLGLLCLIVGCSSNQEPSYDEAEVLKKTEAIVQQINEENYEGVLTDVVKELKSLSPEKLKEACDGLGDKGAFVAYDEHEMVLQKGFAVMGIIVKYEHMDIQYTISFDEDLKLAGFYLKQV